MIREQSSNQTVLDFYLPFDGKLDPNNRWVKLAETIPWDELGAVYCRSLSRTMGPPATPSRVVIGAMIIKHMKKLADEEVIEDIRENPYYQYFLGFSDFQNRTIFVPSLFVEIRKRLGQEQLSEINHLFLSHVNKDSNQDDRPTDPPTNSPTGNGSETPPAQTKKQHSGMLILDASVAPSDIRYPTDVELLNTAREKAEYIIDELWKLSPIGLKPRTYRQVARKEYLAFSHQRKPWKKTIRKMLGKQLGYLRRDLGHIDRLLDQHPDAFPLKHKYQRTLWIIRELYDQQRWMYDHRRHQVSDRIVSISQPYVRPIVRGKAGKRTEFGAKISGVVIDGYVYLDNLSWNAYNEQEDLIQAVGAYRDRFGYDPESVNADKIYWNRKNRSYLKSEGINLYGGSPLGRPVIKDQMSIDQRNKHREQSNRRNWIEAKFGEGKRKYGLGLVMAKTARTSESWIAMVIFVMNLARQMRNLSLSLFLSLIKMVKKQWFWSKEIVRLLTVVFSCFETHNADAKS